jgi:DNA-binding PucR family transcriptional regulator
LRRIVERKAAQAEALAATMRAVYAAEIPAYRRITDPALLEDIRSVSEALVRVWLDVMGSGEPPSPEALRPLAEGARRRVAQGIDLHSLLRAYRVGMRVMWHDLINEPEWRQPTLQTELGQIAELALDYADRISTEVAATYVDERTRLTRERVQQRSMLLEVILAGPELEALHGPPELDRPHAVVVFQVAPGLTVEGLESVGDRVEAALAAPLWTIRHHSVIAAVPVEAGQGRAHLLELLRDPARVREVLAVGVGGDARGARESRQSYREASDALRIGSALVADGRSVYDFQEFASAIALASQPDQARRFVATALSSLGDIAQRSWALPTLEAYIARQYRTKETAATLGVHQNTVKYRLRELQEYAGPQLADPERAGALLLAVRLRRLLGRA